MLRQLKNYTLTAFLFFFTLVAFGQIDMADSTVQAITYWEKGEKQNYSISIEKIKIKNSDTTSREMTTYDVEVSVLQASEKSYTVQWLYKDIVTSSPSPIAEKIINISKDMKIVFQTDELGTFVEVVNWQEVKDYIQKTVSILRTGFKDIPEMDNILTQIEAKYSTKEIIEATSIKDIQQFHSFHGGKYKLGELLEGNLKAPNIYGSEPFDATLSVYLDEINEENNNFIIRSTQEINKEQLTNATFDHLETLAKKMNTTPPKREDVKEIGNEIHTASRIHETGWIIYSIQTAKVTVDNSVHIEERIIELK